MAASNENINESIREQGAPKLVAPAHSLEEYIQLRLSQTSVNQVMIASIISLRALKELRDAGIHTARDLERHESVPRIDSRQWTTIQKWHEGLRTRFIAEYNARRFDESLPPQDILGCNPKWDYSVTVDDKPQWWLCGDVEGKQT